MRETMATAHDDAVAYAGKLNLTASDREKIVRCLGSFPAACKSRGMFFEGVLDAVKRMNGEAAARAVIEDADIKYRITNFGLFPHRDFYKIFYRAARLIHPRSSISDAMHQIAQSFYPAMFAESLAGKTMAVLLGKDPVQVLGRLVDAYKIAVPWNEHVCERSDRGTFVWRCKVEPCPFYARTLEGIATGMVETVTGRTPRFETIEHSVAESEQRFVFDVSFD